MPDDLGPTEERELTSVGCPLASVTSTQAFACKVSLSVCLSLFSLSFACSLVCSLSCSHTGEVAEHHRGTPGWQPSPVDAATPGAWEHHEKQRTERQCLLHCGNLSKTRTVTPAGWPVWAWLLRGGESGFSGDKVTERLACPEWPAPSMYIQAILNRVSRLYVYDGHDIGI